VTSNDNSPILNNKKADSTWRLVHKIKAHVANKNITLQFSKSQTKLISKKYWKKGAI
jgi:hypothetical protein